MSGPETEKVNNKFRDGMKKAFPSIHWQRIECWQSLGVPDINFCLQGQDYWVESKWCPSKTGKVFSHKLTADQCAWALARSRAGGSAWILARRVDVFRLYDGRDARSVVDHGWEGLWTVEMQKPWDWTEMLKIMRARAEGGDIVSSKLTLGIGA